MLWMLAFTALAADDAQQLDEYEQALSTHQQTIATLDGWLAAPSAVERGRELAEQTEQQAVEFNTAHRKLGAIAGRARQAGDDDTLARVEAIRGRIDGLFAYRLYQQPAAQAAVALQADPVSWPDVERNAVAAARKWTGAAPDAWLQPALRGAAEAERWPFVAAALTWCEAVCTDASPVAELRASVPPETTPDPRWQRAVTKVP